VGLLHEVVPVYHVEGVLEINLQQAHLGPLVLRQSVSKRVSDNLHAPLATYAVVFAIESLTDRLFAPKTEALRNQAPNRVSARERPNRGL